MMSVVSTLVITGLLVIITMYISAESWNKKEQEFWADAQRETFLYPHLQDSYRSVQTWCKYNKPSFVRRAMGWQNPIERFRSSVRIVTRR